LAPLRESFIHNSSRAQTIDALLLGGNLAADDKLADVVLLVEVEEAADLGRTLRSEARGEDLVGEAGDVLLALLDDGEGEDGDVGADDAASDRLPLALTGTALAEARVAVAEEEADTVGLEDTCASAR
jgi:hypothetical protein